MYAPILYAVHFTAADALFADGLPVGIIHKVIGADQLAVMQRPDYRYFTFAGSVYYRRRKLKVYVVKVNHIGLHTVKHPAYFPACFK